MADDGGGTNEAELEDSGLGQRLVAAFVQSLDGEREVATGPDGTRVTIRFPTG